MATPRAIPAALSILLALGACRDAGAKKAAVIKTTVVAAAPQQVGPAADPAAPVLVAIAPEIALPTVRDAAVWVSADVARLARRTQENIEAHGVVDPIDPEKLAKLLPAAPPGWTAVGEPTGHYAERVGFKVATADRMFSRGSDVLRVQIIDGGYHPPIYAPMTASARQKRSDRGGALRSPAAFAGYPAVETITSANSGYDLSVIVATRFLVTVQGSGLTRELGRAVWAGIPREQLAALQ
ncbi:MAG: hypothetical protein M3081_14770 [Gemmatimonadota bacterium]|nr:hypothetical protein [Gemmatimonadota bacterium]